MPWDKGGDTPYDDEVLTHASTHVNRTNTKA